MKFLKLSYREALSALCSAYLLLLFCLYPLYMNGGYVNIGAHKYYFFFYISSGALLLLLSFGAVSLIRGISRGSFGKTDFFLLFFMLETLLSFAASAFKENALRGADGWFMGLLTLFLCCALYFLISRLWSFSQKIVNAALLVSGLVYLLGVLDRFSVYLIPLRLRNPSFISTLGNINWFMGYYSVLTPIGAGYFMYEIGSYAYGAASEELTEKENRQRTIKMTLLSVYVLLAFMAGLSQGSESVFLFFAALFLGLLYLCGKGIFHLEHWFLLLGFWGIAAQGIRLLRVLLPEGYNYETTGLCATVTGNDIAFVLGILCLLLCYALRNFKRRPELYEGLCRYIRRFVFACVPVLLLLWLALGILKTKYGFAAGLHSSVFLFNESFGSGRGEAIKTAFAAFREMPLLNKLFGVGPDAFADFVYSVPSIAGELKAFWPGDRLTNAHCELLTMLVNQGFVGVLLYAGFFISFLLDARTVALSWQEAAPEDTSEKEIFTLIAALAVLCYLVHNLISFATVLNFPFVMMVMAESPNCNKPKVVVR